MTERDDATGLDHTWFRKNENRAGRWTSPDPYNASASLGNPQSFNRYSYVENQPTNFVDPSGLLLIAVCEPDRWDERTATIYAGRCYIIDTGGGVGGIVTPRDLIDVGGGGGGGGGGGFTPPAPKNCLDFVNEVAKTLSSAPHQIAGRFVNKLYERFKNLDNEFGSEGFRKEFQDDNQARHYVGGLWAGFQLGSSAALLAMNAREISWGSIRVGLISIPYALPATASQLADRALNAVSTKHGGGLADGMTRTYELALLIRKEVCE